MNARQWILKMLGAAVALTLVAAPVSAGTSSDAALADTVRRLQGEIDALRAANETVRANNAAMDRKLSRLEAQSDESWLNERRAQEVKTLIHEVLADADTRASLLQDGMTAGHNGSKFFLASADGSFLLEIVGQIQVRYIYNNREEGFTDFDDEEDEFTDPLDENEFGMQIRRTKMEFSGHVASPKLHYAVQLAVSRSSNAVSADKITIGYDLTDDLYIWAGEDKAPFLREELTSSKRQLAVERSLLNELFTADKVQGVGLQWSSDMVKLHAMINDGARSGDGEGDESYAGLSPEPSSKDFHADAVDFAMTGRIDVKLMGDWNQMKDFTSWPGEEMAAFIGAAIHHQSGETGTIGVADDKVTLWTIDGSVEVDGLNIYLAYIGASTDLDSGGDTEPWGVQVMGGYNIPLNNGESVEPFIRWEHLDLDAATGSSDDDEVDLLTAGVNYYFRKHNAKLTVDGVWAFDPLLESMVDASSGLGLLDDAIDRDNEDQFALRLQFQLVW